jgi:acyl carrier protein
MDNKFKEIVASILKIDTHILSAESNTQNTRNWDSLMHWEIIAKIEQYYNVEFTLDEAVEFQNLGEIYKSTTTKIKKNK